MWTYLAYRFPSDAEWLSALDAEGWKDGAPPDVGLIVSGTLYAPPVDEETLGEALPGWHVAGAFMAAPPAAWDGFVIEPPAQMAVMGRTPVTLADYARAVDAHVEATARARGYNDAAKLMAWSLSTNSAWAAEGSTFIAWQDQVYVEAFDAQAAWEAGGEMLTITALIASLPVIVWPA